MAMNLYRSMIEDTDGRPLAVGTARGLGVRPGEIPDEDGWVEPGNGGMSVALHDLANLQTHRRPPEHGGTGLDPVWTIQDDELGDLIRCEIDPRRPNEHGMIEPVRPMSLEEYELALAETRDLWRKCR